MSTYPSEQVPLLEPNAGPGGLPSPQVAPAREPPERFAAPHILDPGPPWHRLPEPEPDSAPKPARPGGARRGRGPSYNWREVARLLADGHHPIIIANLTDTPTSAIRRQLRRSRRLRQWIEELRRLNADHIGWRMQALRNELAESLVEAVKKGDRTLMRWLAQELGLAHVPTTDPAGAPPEPKARTLAGRYDPSAIAAAAEPPAPPKAEEEKEEHGTYTLVLGNWDENGTWIDPCTRDHFRQTWYGPDGRKTVVINEMLAVNWREFVAKRLGKAEAEARIKTEKIRVKSQELQAKNQAAFEAARAARLAREAQDRGGSP